MGLSQGFDSSECLECCRARGVGALTCGEGTMLRASATIGGGRGGRDVGEGGVFGRSELLGKTEARN